jgi:hypothetical protein
MSKTKLALLVFALAFGVNIVAFLWSKKTFTVDEVKNVWLYELPPTASPLDSYSSLDIGPDQGIIGTLYQPNYLEPATPAKMLLASHQAWDEKSSTFTFDLVAGANYSDNTPIVAADFVSAHEYLVKQIPADFSSTLWHAWRDSKFEAVSPTQLKISFPVQGLKSEERAKFIAQILTHPLSGPIHAKNLAELQKNEKVKGDWISSGPYKVRKWNPKEIILVSRDQFPVMMPAPFFRTLRFQSAPVKNPSCEFMEGKLGEEKPSLEHQELKTSETMHVLWICRSWKDPTRFCADPDLRANLSIALSKNPGTAKGILTNQKVKYRIPFGSDPFRAEFKKLMNDRVQAAGGTIEEVSYFFKPSTDADIELEFVAAPMGEDPKMAETFGLLSTRMGDQAFQQLNLVGEVETFPMSILMKNMKGDTYQKVFLEPDLAEKKLGI